MRTFPIPLIPLLLCGVLLSFPALAQVFPPHPPLRILIVSDEVNPHGLPPEDLTQPGEISAALLATPGLNLEVVGDAVVEIATDQIEDATALLSVLPEDPAAYDVLIYFAHRIPNGANAQVRQAAFVAAAESFLASGGGIVSFHHGIYRTAGKESMQNLLGAEATGAVPWNEVEGQNVIAVNENHFVINFGVSYPSSVNYEDPGLGIPLGLYPTFNNTPDERYPNLQILPAAENIEPLLASDYDSGQHLLSYVETRPAWLGAVIMYQPGEYQPHALEPGNNYQILLNAVIYLAQMDQGELLFGDGFESGNLDLWSSVTTGVP